MVRSELDHLIARGALKPGDTISEISAGSTAESLAYHCRELGLNCTLFVPKSLSEKMLEKLRGFGAELHLLDPKNAYALYDDFTAKNEVRKFDQVADRNLRRHYEELGQHLHDLGQISKIIGCVGTGHSLVGIGKGFGSLEVLVSAEPLLPQTVSGIRNIRFESMGEKDPYELAHLIPRIEINAKDSMLYHGIATDLGTITASPSFGVALGALDIVLGAPDIALGAPSSASKAVIQDNEPISVFVIGAANRRLSE